jgi:O-antigen ligase
MENLKIGPLQIFLTILLAVAISVGMNSGQSTLMLGVVVLCSLLLAAFLSTPVSLYLLVFSMLLGPEIMLGSGATADQTLGRGVTFRFDDFLLVIMGFVWLVKAAIHKEETAFKHTPLNGKMLFYAVACFFATMIGIVAGRVRPLNGFFFNLKYFEYFFLYFMVVNAINTRRQARGLIVASFVTCFLVALYAIAQIPSGARASAPFEGEEGEPNTLGGYLVFMMSIAIGLWLTPGAVPRKLPLVVLIVTGSLALMATLSRASFLAFAVVLLLVAVYSTIRKPLVFLLIAAVIASGPVWAPKKVTERIMFTFGGQAAERGQIKVGKLRVDTSTSDRLRSWQRSFDWWKKNPVWGGGITGGPFMDAMYPRVLVETGLLGSVAFLVLLWATFQMGMRTYKEARGDPPLQGLALGFLFGFVGMVVHGIGANTFIIVRIMEPFWLFAALLVRGPALEQESQAADAETITMSLIHSQHGSRLRSPSAG